ncbi:hypothetical protein EA772_19445 [Pedobacter sp. G11]|uniref:hypothetical protein n=1 Tax=Pedobacter sp. G11 TaxID=2482728 RepID=UPI000F5EF62A|nr:hypothetical protein [Pedobacter sp. G11]AZI27407.1 hypothetical protein EA772_19445 [Pedobacter sp. G11]
MGQNRVGVVSHIDIENKCGTILDENHQDIGFNLEGLSETVNLDARVSFEIELSDKGLIATNVALIA